MADPERYATVSSLSAMLTDRPSALVGLSDVLDAASGAVESYCGRVFTKAETASARQFTVNRSDRVHVDDIAALTDLAVKVGTPGAFVAISAYWLTPLNSFALGRPAEWVYSGDLFTVATGPTVEVTALWGWPSVPAEVSRATLLMAARLWSRQSSPTGVAGFGDYGVVRVTSSDADVARLLDPYAKPSGGW